MEYYMILGILLLSAIGLIALIAGLNYLIHRNEK